MTTNGVANSRSTAVISIVRQGDTARVGSVRSSAVDENAITALVKAAEDAAHAAPEARDAHQWCSPAMVSPPIGVIRSR